MNPSLQFHYALLIGVGVYIHPLWPVLPATVQDVQEFAALLRASEYAGYAAENVHELIGPLATAAQIRSVLQSLAAKADTSATVLIYFSGHGVRTEMNDAVEVYLCASDTDPDALATTGISGGEFSAYLRTLRAQKVLVILDTCHAAGAASPRTVREPRLWSAGLPESYVESLAQGGGRVVFASSKADQISWNRQSNDHGLFTWHLLEGLRGAAAVHGDGLIRVLDLFYYVSQQVKRQRPEQEPILHAHNLDDNFPIALSPLGTRSPRSLELAAIREQLHQDPIAGARRLSEYLAVHAADPGMRNEVDLKRSELERLRREQALYGSRDGERAAENRVIHFLFEACTKIEQTLPAPDQVPGGSGATAVPSAPQSLPEPKPANAGAVPAPDGGSTTKEIGGSPPPASESAPRAINLKELLRNIPDPFIRKLEERLRMKKEFSHDDEWQPTTDDKSYAGAYFSSQSKKIIHLYDNVEALQDELAAANLRNAILVDRANAILSQVVAHGNELERLIGGAPYHRLHTATREATTLVITYAANARRSINKAAYTAASGMPVPAYLRNDLTTHLYSLCLSLDKLQDHLVAISETANNSPPFSR